MFEDSPLLTPFRHTQRIITEPDDFGDAVSGIELAVDFQRRQERPSQVEQFQSGSWALDFGEANVRTRVRGVLRGGWGSFCFALGPGKAFWNGQPAAPGTVALLPPDGEVDGRTAAGFSWLTAAVSPEIWQRCMTISQREDGSSGNLSVCHFPGQRVAELARRFRACRQRLSAAGDVKAAVMDTVDLISSVFTHVSELGSESGFEISSFRNRARLARRAEAWMIDHLSDPVQVPDLCLAMRVSRREMEYAFRTVYDQSPSAHLQALRLNAIRRALLRSGGGCPVTTIAYDHGVTHLGRFAKNYRTLFGESPSETRRS